MVTDTAPVIPVTMSVTVTVAVPRVDPPVTRNTELATVAVATTGLFDTTVYWPDPPDIATSEVSSGDNATAEGENVSGPAAFPLVTLTVPVFPVDVSTTVTTAVPRVAPPVISRFDPLTAGIATDGLLEVAW